MAIPFPKHLSTTSALKSCAVCFRCKQRIAHGIETRVVIVNGCQVRMHEECARICENEEEEPYGSEEQIAA